MSRLESTEDEVTCSEAHLTLMLAAMRMDLVSVPFGNEESVFVPCSPLRAVQKGYILDTEEFDDAVPVPTIQ